MVSLAEHLGLIAANLGRLATIAERTFEKLYPVIERRPATLGTAKYLTKAAVEETQDIDDSETVFCGPREAAAYLREKARAKKANQSAERPKTGTPKKSRA